MSHKYVKTIAEIIHRTHTQNAIYNPQQNPTWDTVVEDDKRWDEDNTYLPSLERDKLPTKRQ